MRWAIGRDSLTLEAAHPAALAVAVSLLATVQAFETSAGPGLLVLAAGLVLLRWRWFLLIIGSGLYVSLGVFFESGMTRHDFAELALALGAVVLAFVVRSEALHAQLKFHAMRLRLLQENGRLAAEALLESQERQRCHYLNSASTEGLAVYELGQVVSCSAGLAELSRLAEREILRRGLPQLFRQEDRSAIEQELKQPSDMPIDAVLLCPDGRRVPVRVQAKTAKSQGISLTLVSVRDSSREKRTEQSLRALADRDELTGLVNRRFLFRRLESCLRRCGEGSTYAFALLYVDLDDFKQINDTLGHSTGDAVLKSVGRTLHDSIREGDIAARIGGDEFAVIIDGICTRETVEEIVMRLSGSINRPIPVLNDTIRCSASIGVSYFSDVGWADPGIALRKADEAMYRAKRRKGFRGSPGRIERHISSGPTELVGSGDNELVGGVGDRSGDPKTVSINDDAVSP